MILRGGFDIAVNSLESIRMFLQKKWGKGHHDNFTFLVSKRPCERDQEKTRTLNFASQVRDEVLKVFVQTTGRSTREV